MTHIPSTDEAVFLRPAVTMALRCSAATDAAHRAVDAIAIRLMKPGAKAPLANHKRVIAAIVADLIKGAAFQPLRPCFRPMKASSFTGEPFGYRIFNVVQAGLVSAGYVEVYRGWGDPRGGKGRITRFLPAEKLLAELATFGIAPTNYREHFADLSGRALVSDPIRLKGSSSRGFKARASEPGYTWGKIPGPVMAVDSSNPVVAELAAQVSRINDFLAEQTYEGMAFEGLFRGFNEGDQHPYGWNKGGRLYAVGGGYQSMPREQRPAIRINGEAVVEVDISASHLTIVHALAGEPLPGTGDPYIIDGFDREGVKLFVNMTIGNGKVQNRWSPGATTAYAKQFERSPKAGRTGSLKDDYPFKPIRDAALKHIPLLHTLPSLGSTWADLQFVESKILIEAMTRLIYQSIPTLPLHDSLICKECDSIHVSNTISQSFYDQLYIFPSIRCKGR